MDHGHLSMVADKFQWVFSEALRNPCGTDVTFGRRQRVITPLRLGLALTAPCASQPVESLADFPGGFHALFGTTVPSQAFYNQWAKPHCADCARTLAARLLSDMTLKVLGCAKGRACGELRPLVLQDGSSFAIHDGLRAVFPGRLKAVKPAAVALHTPMDLLGEAPPTVGFTPDTANAQAFVPAPASRRDAGLLADRGYLDWPSRRRVQAETGGFLRRAKARMHAPVGEALREEGKRWPSLRPKRLQAIHAKLPKRQRGERGGQGQVDGHPLSRRLSIRGHPRPKRFCSFLTNVPPTRYPLEVIGRAYQWRWQVERLFKEWKSYANLHAFDTTKGAMVEGLICTAIAAAARKRFLAHMTHRFVAVPMSTRTGAMGAVHVLGDLVRALQRGDVAELYAALEKAVMSLACHAQRAHPARDRQTGRSPLGLEPLWGSDDFIEVAKAA